MARTKVKTYIIVTFVLFGISHGIPAGTCGISHALGNTKIQHVYVFAIWVAVFIGHITLHSIFMVCLPNRKSFNVAFFFFRDVAFTFGGIFAPAMSLKQDWLTYVTIVCVALIQFVVWGIHNRAFKQFLNTKTAASTPIVVIRIQSHPAWNNELPQESRPAHDKFLPSYGEVFRAQRPLTVESLPPDYNACVEDELAVESLPPNYEFCVDDNGTKY